MLRQTHASPPETHNIQDVGETIVAERISVILHLMFRVFRGS